MQLWLDDIPVEASPGESILTLVKRTFPDECTFAERPLAAKMAGETFSLHYAPLARASGKEEDVLRSSALQNTVQSTGELPLRPLRTSGRHIRLLRYRDGLGRRIYENSLFLLLLAAFRELFPKYRVRIEYSVGDALRITPFETDPAAARQAGCPLTQADVEALKARCIELVREDVPLKRIPLDTDEAIALFEEAGRPDTADLLKWRQRITFQVYRLHGYFDYFYGEMVPSTGYLSVFDLHLEDGILYLMLPSTEDPETPTVFRDLTALGAAFREDNERAALLRVANVSDLNRSIRDGSIRDVIRTNEGLHEKRYALLADEIVRRGARAVLLAGPSSSGKTTSANRLSVQLRILGKQPLPISLDSYYIDRDKLQKEPDGSYDLEHIRAIDTDLFRQNLSDLLRGKTVELPEYDFVTHRRIKGREVRMEENTVPVIEGIHGLNPLLLPEGIDKNEVFRLFVTALTVMNLDDHNRIRTTDVRLLRRIVRDYYNRGASPEDTLSMWNSVRKGEERWIFPYQEQADAIFNSSLFYETAVLKPYIFPILSATKPDSPYYTEIRSIIKMLNYVTEVQAEDEIPPTSVMREFIGGNVFYR